jgi:hypothetical protein
MASHSSHSQAWLVSSDCTFTLMDPNRIGSRPGTCEPTESGRLKRFVSTGDPAEEERDGVGCEGGQALTLSSALMWNLTSDPSIEVTVTKMSTFVPSSAVSRQVIFESTLAGRLDGHTTLLGVWPTLAPSLAEMVSSTSPLATVFPPHAVRRRHEPRTRPRVT